MDHPIPNTENVPSVQIIIPQRQIGRKNDIYIMMVSDVHSVSKKGTYIAIISTTVETQNPEEEIKLAFDLIGPVKEKFIKVIFPLFRFLKDMFQLNKIFLMV